MKYTKIKEICDIFVSRPITESKKEKNSYLITPSCLLANNTILGKEKVSISGVTKSKYILLDEDILVKRLNPTFVTIFSSLDMPAYSSGNIIVLRPNDKSISKYIASILEVNGMDVLSHFASKGVTIQAISAKELAEIKIPLISKEKQILIGKMWRLNQEKQRLKEVLSYNEDIYFNTVIKKIIKEEK